MNSGSYVSINALPVLCITELSAITYQCYFLNILQTIDKLRHKELIKGVAHITCK